LPITVGLEGNFFVVLKSYFDGGNQADSTQYEYLTLATVSGSKHEWIPFERDWKKVLRKHEIPYLHTTDAVTGNGIFRGWNEKRRFSALEDLVCVAGKHIALPVLYGSTGRYGLFPYLVTVNLNDFASVELHPDMARNANELCIRQALHSTMVWGQEQAACHEYHLFFDQGEPFYGYVQHLIQSKRAKKEAHRLQQISQTSEVNMRRVPAIQLADLYAWAVSHTNLTEKAEWHRNFLKMPYSGEYHTKESMTAENAVNPEIWKSWKIPRRKETK